MKNFYFTIEQKITNWETLEVVVKADSEEEALEKCKREEYDCINNSEMDMRFSEVLPLDQNFQESTFYIMNKEDKILYRNGL